jgi:hypothetical protein
MHHVSSSSGGAIWSSSARAYRIERVMPIFGSVSVPSRSKKTALQAVDSVVPTRSDYAILSAQRFGEQFYKGNREIVQRLTS